jgi:hypothetical protein
MAFIVNFGHLGEALGGVAGRVEELDFGTGAGAFSGAHHGPPIVDGVLFEQKDFEPATGLGIDGVQAGGNDTGIVEDENVAIAEESDEILEVTVFDLTAVAMEDEEAGLIPAGGRLLGD